MQFQTGKQTQTANRGSHKMFFRVVIQGYISNNPGLHQHQFYWCRIRQLSQISCILLYHLIAGNGCMTTHVNCLHVALPDSGAAVSQPKISTCFRHVGGVPSGSGRKSHSLDLFKQFRLFRHWLVGLSTPAKLAPLKWGAGSMTFCNLSTELTLYFSLLKTTCTSRIFPFPTIVIRQTVKHVARQREEHFFSVDTFGSA